MLLRVHAFFLYGSLGEENVVKLVVLVLLVSAQKKVGVQSSLCRLVQIQYSEVQGIHDACVRLCIHTPRIELGPAAWKDVVLPLHHVCRQGKGHPC